MKGSEGNGNGFGQQKIEIFKFSQILDFGSQKLLEK
jgi:hypothetical protein